MSKLNFRKLVKVYLKPQSPQTNDIMQVQEIQKKNNV